MSNIFLSFLAAFFLVSYEVSVQQDSAYSVRDKNIYFLDEPLNVEDSDSATFEPLANNYSRDKNHVYYWSQEWGWQVVEGAEPYSFQTLWPEYGIDQTAAYRTWHRIEGSDPYTFEVIYYPDDFNSDYDYEYCGNQYSNDAKSVYYGIKKIIGADNATFEALDCSYGKDSKAVYQYGVKMKGISPANFYP